MTHLSSQVLQGMKQYEIRRQENIQQLVYTERSHLHRLKIMKHVRHPLPLTTVYGITVAQLVSLIPRLLVFRSGNKASHLWPLSYSSRISLVFILCSIVTQRVV